MKRTSRKSKKIPVVILCGGMGTRLREETESKPKPLVEVGSHPILWHIMSLYSHYGFRDFILCLGYKGALIKQFFLNYEVMNADCVIELGKNRGPTIHGTNHTPNWVITLADTGEHAMTGARLRQIAKYITGDTFMLTYGDGVANIDLQRLLAFHRSHGRIATVTGVHPSSRFGELIVEKDRVVKFGEKPQVREGYVNGGFFVFDRRVFEYLDHDEACVLEGAPLERLAEDGELRVYHHAGFWQCMDTYRDYKLLNEMWAAGKAEWRVWA